MGAHHHAPPPPPPCCGVAKRKEKREKGLEEEGMNKERGVVFVGDLVAHHDGEWIVVVAKW